MKPGNVIIKSKDNEPIFIKELVHLGIPGLWICSMEAWRMKEKNITQKEFRNLVMQFIVEQKEFNKNQLEFNNDQLEFNKNQLEFNKNITNKLDNVSDRLDNVIQKNNLKT